MIACIVCHDEQVLGIFRPLLPELIIRQPEDVLSHADIYIWDLDSCPEIPRSILDNRDNPALVVASEATLRVVDQTLLLHCCPLLKPINPFTARAFLDLAANGCGWKKRALEADQLSSDRETLVQYALATSLRLQQYDRQRTNFLARALHDLRAPLTALHGYCGLLADGQLGPLSPEQRDLLHRMQASTRRLSKHSAGMFDLSVLGHIRRKPQLTEGDIEDAILQSIHEVLPLAQEKDITLSTSLDTPDLPLRFEAEQIIQVLVNLLENACKFTPFGGAIEVRGANVPWDFVQHDVPAAAPAQATGYRIDIQDTGTGIQPSLLPSIFEEYTSYSWPRDRSGGGLGLAISKMIVTAHQGSIFAANANPGAVFSVILPFSAGARYMAQDATAYSQVSFPVSQEPQFL